VPFLDLSILAAAPVRMIRSGLGDSLCRATAQADWLLSHLLFDLPYRTMPFRLLAGGRAGAISLRPRSW
jgi:glycerol-1-phosphate dehydrogenase [NAD(P)+]